MLYRFLFCDFIAFYFASFPDNEVLGRLMRGIAPPVTTGILPSHFSIVLYWTSSGVSDSDTNLFASACAFALISVESASPWAVALALSADAFASATSFCLCWAFWVASIPHCLSAHNPSGLRSRRIRLWAKVLWMKFFHFHKELLPVQ